MGSRDELIIENILGASHELTPPESREEAILQAILNETEYTGETESRMGIRLPWSKHRRC